MGSNNKKGPKNGAPVVPSMEEINNILSNNSPKINEFGKYIVRIFYQGKWRKIMVDDSIPLDSENRILLPISCTMTKNDLDQSQSGNKNKMTYIEAWPLLLTKALLKIWSLTEENLDGLPMFHPITCLTGYIPKTIQADFYSKVKNSNSDINNSFTRWELDDNLQENNPLANNLVISRHNNNCSYLLSQIRECPLETPSPPVEIPNWKLIRPTLEIQN